MRFHPPEKRPAVHQGDGTFVGNFDAGGAIPTYAGGETGESNSFGGWGAPPSTGASSGPAGSGLAGSGLAGSGLAGSGLAGSGGGGGGGGGGYGGDTSWQNSTLVNAPVGYGGGNYGGGSGGSISTKGGYGGYDPKSAAGLGTYYHNNGFLPGGAPSAGPMAEGGPVPGDGDSDDAAGGAYSGGGNSDLTSSLSTVMDAYNTLKNQMLGGQPTAPPSGPPTPEAPSEPAPPIDTAGDSGQVDPTALLSNDTAPAGDPGYDEGGKVDPSMDSGGGNYSSQQNQQSSQYDSPGVSSDPVQQTYTDAQGTPQTAASAEAANNVQAPLLGQSNWNNFNPTPSQNVEDNRGGQSVLSNVAGRISNLEGVIGNLIGNSTNNNGGTLGQQLGGNQ